MRVSGISDSAAGRVTVTLRLLKLRFPPSCSNAGVATLALSLHPCLSPVRVDPFTSYLAVLSINHIQIERVAHEDSRRWREFLQIPASSFQHENRNAKHSRIIYLNDEFVFREWWKVTSLTGYKIIRFVQSDRKSETRTITDCPTFFKTFISY